MAKDISVSITGELEEELNELARATASKIINILAIRTPKKTGEATGEWQVGINSRPTSTTKRLDLTGASTALQGKQDIEKAKEFKYPTIHITNLAEHIEILNTGYSDQAPAKFVELAIIEAQNAR